MSKKECHPHKHYIDLFRHEGKLLRADDDDQEYPELDGLDAIPGDEPAAIVIHYNVYAWHEPTTFDDPGGWHYETELNEVKLQVGFSESLVVHSLPEPTQKVIWDNAFDEVNEI